MRVKVMAVAHWYAKMMASSNWPVWLVGALDVVVLMYQAFMLKFRHSLDGLTKLLA